MSTLPWLPELKFVFLTASPPPRALQDDDINVVSNYKPGVATGATTALPTMVIDPITGQTVAASDLSDHMRIQLMDPKWREEQARAASKQKDTALAEGDSIAASLKSLARKRGDIFGSAEVSRLGVVAQPASTFCHCRKSTWTSHILRCWCVS